MSLMHHLLAHAAIHQRQDRLKKLSDKVQKHKDDADEAHRQAMAAQAEITRMHKALALNKFGRKLTTHLQEVEKTRRLQIHALVKTIDRMEQAKTDMQNALAKKSVEHENTRKRLEAMRQEIDSAILSLEHLKNQPPR
ncbi:hypothetical protein HY572_02385 [Candidatus Micrarchaeota archaeon]|nr:hypothetical protein [Candidatus Micrarchaeota archaeon]